MSFAVLIFWFVFSFCYIYQTRRQDKVTRGAVKLAMGQHFGGFLHWNDIEFCLHHLYHKYNVKMQRLRDL
jgi:hypothetical protein